MLEELVRRNPFEVPQSLIGRQVDAFVEDLMSRLGDQRAELERDAQRLEKLREDYRPRAEQQVRAMLALDAFAEKSGIAVTDQEVDQRIGDLAMQAGNHAARVREIYRDDAARAELRGRMTRERALEQILAAARIEDVDVAGNVVAPNAENG